MIQPVELDLTIYRGADFSQSFKLEQPDGSQVDLTGCTIVSQIRRAQRETAPLIVGFTVEMPDPASGEFSLKLTDAQTLAVSRKRGYYDVIITDPAADRYIYVQGRVTFVNSVSVPS